MKPGWRCWSWPGAPRASRTVASRMAVIDFGLVIAALPKSCGASPSWRSGRCSPSLPSPPSRPFYDLASLDAIYRVMAFVVLGVLLLLSAYAYRRFDTGRDQRAPLADSAGEEMPSAPWRGGQRGDGGSSRRVRSARLNVEARSAMAATDWERARPGMPDDDRAQQFPWPLAGLDVAPRWRSTPSSSFRSSPCSMPASGRRPRRSGPRTPAARTSSTRIAWKGSLSSPSWAPGSSITC